MNRSSRRGVVAATPICTPPAALLSTGARVGPRSSFPSSWIDDRDVATKRNFAFLMFLFALAETGEKKALPTITIPAQ
jgi:hypothetical protein